MNQLKRDLKVIGVMRLSALGDIIWTLPMLHHLMKAYPEHRIVYITSSPFSSIVEGIKGVETIVVDKPRTFKDYLKLIKKLRAIEFDLFLCTQANLRVNVLFPFIRAKRKIGFDSRRGRDAHHLFVPEEISYRREHALKAFLGFLDHLEVSYDNSIEYKIPITPHEDEWFLKTGFQNYICIHPKASHEYRTWPIERYIELTKLFVNNHDVKVILTGTSADFDFCERIRTSLKSDQVINMANKTSLLELAKLYKESSLVIAPDSGPIHLANAVGAKVIGLYVSLPSSFTGPYGQEEYCIDKYKEAAQRFLKLSSEEVPWRKRVSEKSMMKLIKVSEVYHLGATRLDL